MGLCVKEVGAMRKKLTAMQIIEETMRTLAPVMRQTADSMQVIESNVRT